MQWLLLDPTVEIVNDGSCRTLKFRVGTCVAVPSTPTARLELTGQRRSHDDDDDI